MRRALALQTERWSLVVVHTPDGALWRWLASVPWLWVGGVLLLLAFLLLSVAGFPLLLFCSSNPVDTTILQMGEVNKRVELHALKHGVPDGLVEVYEPDPSPRDAWGHPFLYVYYPSSDYDFDLVSLGAHGRPGGSDLDADIRWSEL